MGLRLKAELDGDGSGFDNMMRRANASKDKFAQGFSSLKSIIASTFAIGAVVNLSKKTIDLASHLRDVSDALAVNVEWFQKRANAAKLAGGTEDDLFKLLDTINKSREEAFNKPGQEMSQRFSRLGLDQADVSGLNTMDFFDKLTKAFANGADAQTTVDVEKVGGRSARNLLAAFFNQFQGDVSVMSEDIINQLDEIGDSFEILSQKLTVAVAPAITLLGELFNGIVNWTKQVGAFWGGFAVGGPEAGARRMMSVEIDQQTEKEQFDKAKEAMRQSRRRREQTPPQFDKLELEKVKESKPGRSPNLPSDGTAAVGGFLGRNPGLVNSIANQQLSVAKEQLKVLNEIKMAFKNAAIFQAGARSGILVPPG